MLNSTTAPNFFSITSTTAGSGFVSSRSRRRTSIKIYNARTGQECRVTTGESNDQNTISVKSYREILHQYLRNPESKFNGPDGNPCDAWTRGILQRRQITAGPFIYCGKEFKRKMEQGPADHETDFKFKVYANGRVSADADVLRARGSSQNARYIGEHGCRAGSSAISDTTVGSKPRRCKNS